MGKGVDRKRKGEGRLAASVSDRTKKAMLAVPFNTLCVLNPKYRRRNGCSYYCNAALAATLRVAGSARHNATIRSVDESGSGILNR